MAYKWYEINIGADFLNTTTYMDKLNTQDLSNFHIGRDNLIQFVHAISTRRQSCSIASLLLSFSFFFCCLSADSQPNDWTMTVSVKPLNNFLNYSGSSLAPVVRASVYYMQNGQNVHYEDLYYSHNLAVGCRQYHSLDVIPGTAGAIQITNLSENDSLQGYAAANVALRAYVILYSQKSPVKNLTVPLASFDNLLQGLATHGFRPFEIVPDQQFFATIVMEVVSDSQDRMQYLYYNDANS